jgi:hypothetical protein
MAAYFFNPDVMRGHSYHDPSWLLPNPFASIESAMRDRSTINAFDSFCLPFLLVWATIVTAANIPWFLGQLARFRPSAKTRRATAPQAA